MEDYQEFILEIESLLKQQAENLEGTVLKRLHNNFSVYHKSLQTIFNVLVRKSLLQEDPYKYEHKISEITIPSVSPIAENNKGMEMSIRLSGFESQLEFLIHYYQFSLDFLDMKKIKTLATLTTYIKWEKGASASEHNTAILYELMGKISAETDQVSNGILKNAQQGLIKQTKLILKDLKELSSYYRESYKQEIRQKVLPLVQIDEKSYRADPETASRRIKQRFSQVMERTPFYNDLVTELLAELFAENGEKMRQDLLSRFQPKEKKTEKRKNVTHKSLLTDALKILALGGTYLEQAMTKVRSNMAVIENKKESLGEKLKKWLTGLVNKEGNRKIMDLEIFEEDSSLPKTVRIDYQLFSEKNIQTVKTASILRFGDEPDLPETGISRRRRPV